MNEPSPKRAIGVYLLLVVPLLWYVFSGPSAPSTGHMPWFWPLLIPVFLFGEQIAFIMYTVLGFVLIGLLIQAFKE